MTIGDCARDREGALRGREPAAEESLTIGDCARDRETARGLEVRPETTSAGRTERTLRAKALLSIPRGLSTASNASFIEYPASRRSLAVSIQASAPCVTDRPPLPVDPTCAFTDAEAGSIWWLVETLAVCSACGEAAMSLAKSALSMQGRNRCLKLSDIGLFRAIALRVLVLAPTRQSGFRNASYHSRFIPGLCICVDLKSGRFRLGRPRSYRREVVM